MTLDTLDDWFGFEQLLEHWQSTIHKVLKATGRMENYRRVVNDFEPERHTKFRFLKKLTFPLHELVMKLYES